MNNLIENLPQRNSVRLAKLKARRKLWLGMHLYLGLIFGAILAIVGLTGSIMVFYQELQEVVNPELFNVSLPAEQNKKLQPLDTIIKAAETAKPANSEFFKLYYPRKADIAYKFLYFVRDENQANKKGDGYYLFVDPYTLKVNGIQLWHPKDKYWGRPLVSFIMQLHWCLLLGKSPGGTMVGILGLLGIFSVLTGLIVWWPLTGKFKQALTIKHPAGLVRRVFDLHKTVGFYLSLALLPVLFSGVYMSFPDQMNTVVKLFTTVESPNVFESIPPEIHSSKPQAGQQAISFSTVENIVQQNHPAGRLWMLNAPKNPADVFVVMKRDVAEVSQYVGYRDFAIDQYTGQILKVYDSGAGSAGDVLIDWQWPLHSGHAFGWPGRILVLLAGVACPVLYITGVMRWFQKRRAKAVKRINCKVDSL